MTNNITAAVLTADDYYELAYQHKKLAEDTADYELHKLHWDTSEALAAAGLAAGRIEADLAAQESARRVNSHG